MDQEQRPAPMIQFQGAHRFVGDVGNVFGHTLPLLHARSAALVFAMNRFEDAYRLNPSKERLQQYVKTTIYAVRSMFRQRKPPFTEAMSALHRAELTVEDATRQRNNGGLATSLAILCTMRGLYSAGTLPHEALIPIHEKALAAARAATTFDKTIPYFWFNEGICSANLGFIDDAKSCFQKTRRLILKYPRTFDFPEREVTNALDGNPSDKMRGWDHVVKIWSRATLQLVVLMTPGEHLSGWNTRYRDKAIALGYLTKYSPGLTMFFINPLNYWGHDSIELQINRVLPEPITSEEE